ncbi:XkdX family protein [Limosilactobacillus fermentum]
MFEMIKRYYEMGLYLKTDLDLFVKVNFITQEEENQILGNGESQAPASGSTVTA